MHDSLYNIPLLYIDWKFKWFNLIDNIIIEIAFSENISLLWAEVLN